MSYALINGELLPENNARIAIDERGFRFGDGAFETVPVHNATPYLWPYHLARLEAGLSALHISASTAGLLADAAKLVTANHCQEGLIRLYVSRGAGSKGYLPSSPHLLPLVVMQTMPLPAAPIGSVSLWQSKWVKIPPSALPPQVKLAQGVNPMLARMEAVDHQCYDALQLDSEGYVAETSSANIFWLHKRVLHTPSLEGGALAGVTRKRIIELSPYPVQEGRYHVSDLAAAEEVVITNAAFGVVPVASLKRVQLQSTPYLWHGTTLADTLTALRKRDIDQGHKKPL